MTPSREPSAPVAPVRPVRLEAHGVVREDEYFWMNRRDDPEVIAHLQAENRWTDAVMAHTRDLEDRVFHEIRGRIVEDDSTVPWLRQGYWYYTRFETGGEYPIHARKKESLDAGEEVFLDVEELARDHPFYQVGNWDVSGNGRLLAFAADTVGRRVYTLHIKDLESGLILESIPGVTANLVWADDNRTLFYARQDPRTLRSNRIFRHTLGDPPERDVLVFEEEDERFSVGVSLTRSRHFILVGSHQTLSTEFRFVDAEEPGGPLTLLIPRRRGHLYFPDHSRGHFYIRTNDQAENFSLVRVPVDDPGAGSEEVVPHRPDTLLSDFETFRDHLVLAERREGLTRLRVMRWDSDEDYTLDFGEPAYRAALGPNPEFDTGTLRYLYTSLTTPHSVYDHDMWSRERVLLKRDEVRGGFSPTDYVTQRIHARADDGTDIPVSLVHRRDLTLDGSAPLLVYGYGAYGSSSDPIFSPARLSLLDRGFVYAIAHVRGGQELGRRWYEEGRLARKQNSFTDFIRVAEELVEQGYTNPGGLYAMGGSAGGLLVGGVLNMRPDLFHGVIAAVPFVDVVTTMLDDSIPLTTFEYDEWGNPHDPDDFRTMLAYSPYDNVDARDYPHLLVTTGLHDSQVQYWEPAKWVARLRARKTDTNRLLLRTNMEAGHGGASGRFRALREIAFQYTFLLDLAGTRP